MEKRQESLRLGCNLGDVGIQAKKQKKDLIQSADIIKQLHFPTSAQEEQKEIGDGASAQEFLKIEYVDITAGDRTIKMQTVISISNFIHFPESS